MRPVLEQLPSYGHLFKDPLRASLKGTMTTALVVHQLAKETKVPLLLLQSSSDIPQAKSAFGFWITLWG